VLRPIPGSTGQTNQFNPDGAFGMHRVFLVRQSAGTPTLGDTTYVYNNDGTRLNDDNGSGLTQDNRAYLYDARHNLVYFLGKAKLAGAWNYLEVVSAFDADNRRVFKSVHNINTNKTAAWFFYYDPMDRLTELRYTPDTSASTTYSTGALGVIDDGPAYCKAVPFELSEGP
jgi:hypothetical protein